MTETTTRPANAHGKLASELKGLNAAHANANALANASPNSQVGRIATYRDAALETISAADALDAATGALGEATETLVAREAELWSLDDAFSGRTTAEIDADIAALDPFRHRLPGTGRCVDEGSGPAPETYETERAALESEIADATDAVTEAEAGLTNAETTLTEVETLEEEALMSASNGRVLFRAGARLPAQRTRPLTGLRRAGPITPARRTPSRTPALLALAPKLR